MKTLFVSCVVGCLFAPPAVAVDTITIPQEFAQQRVVNVKVTQMGLVLDLGSPVKSVNLSHLSDVVFIGLDGVLCDTRAECSESQPPTKLLLRRIPPIQFKQQLASPDGSRMLFVSTGSGLYRFRIHTESTPPDYTLVIIQSDDPASLPGFAPSQVPSSITR